MPKPTLATLPWVASLLAEPSLEVLIDDQHDLPDDHLVRRWRKRGWRTCTRFSRIFLE
jgi:hypothetical protein